ncbi:hypothetical protein D3C74_431200 [compost metagenome]
MSPPNLIRRCFRKAKEADFTFLHKLSHSADGLFDGDVRVNTMLIVQVDVICAQLKQAGIN